METDPNTMLIADAAAAVPRRRRTKPGVYWPEIAKSKVTLDIEYRYFVSKDAFMPTAGAALDRID